MKLRFIFNLFYYPLSGIVIYHDVIVGKTVWAVILSVLLGMNMGMDLTDIRDS